MVRAELLAKYRRILNRIHEGGNIYYDPGRLEAYKIIALIASELRKSASDRKQAEFSA